MCRWMIWLGALVLAGCGTADKPSSDARPAGAVTAADRGTQGTQPAGQAAASGDVELTIVDYDGILQHVEQNRGKVVVMDAWSTSCPPCMKEFHNLVALHKQYGPDKLACMSLSFDYEGLDTPQEVKPRVLKFLKSQGATFDNLMSSEESDVLYRKFKLAAVPAVFVYDREGKLRKRFDNERAKSSAEHFTYADVRRLVAELVESPQAEGGKPEAQP